MKRKKLVKIIKHRKRLKEQNKYRPLVGQKLTDALDQTVRDILHLKYPEGICFVSGNKYGWFHPKTNPRGCQVGHYISRRVFALRWDLKNVFPQGAAENQTHQWNTLPFTNRILEVYGKERIDYLNKKYHGYKKQKMTTLEKRAILGDLKKQLQELIDK